MAPSPVSSLPLSVVIVARNEVLNLPRCLASVHGWTDDVLVVLNNTTDESESVSLAAGARVVHLPWLGYRDTKNAALDHAKHNWVLSLDADEEVSPALRTAIGEFFADCDQFAGARFPRKVWFIDRWIEHGDWYPDLCLRLFRRDRARWVGELLIHERIECDGPVVTLRGDLHHFSFPTLSAYLTKINLYADFSVQLQLARREKFSPLATIFRSLWRFFRGYVLRGGFLDGYPGLIIAWATCFGTFLRYTKLYEAERSRNPPPQTEHRS